MDRYLRQTRESRVVCGEYDVLGKARNLNLGIGPITIERTISPGSGGAVRNNDCLKG